MSNTYNWLIDSLDCIPSLNGQNNVISCVHWRVNGSDGTNNSEVYGTQQLTYEEGSLFINYSDLTKDDVIGWVQKAMGIDTVTKLQEFLDKQIENLANPLVITLPLPWTNA